MAGRPRFDFTYAPETIDHLDAIELKYHGVIMRIAPLADVKARLSAYVDQCEAEGPIVITRNGKAVAVLLAPYDDDDLERMMLARSPRFRALLNKSRQSIRQGKGLSDREFWKVVRQRSRRRTAGSVTRTCPAKSQKVVANAD